MNAKVLCFFCFLKLIPKKSLFFNKITALWLAGFGEVVHFRQ
jgi:hypothetical protein